MKRPVLTRKFIPPEIRRDYYVYIYFLLNGTPCWVGKGSGDRYKAHLWSSEENNHTPKEFLRLLQWARLNGAELPVVIIRDNLTAKEAFDLEYLLINTLGRRRNGSGPLLNINIGTKPDKVTRQKISRTKLENPRIVSPETREKMRQAKLGRKQDPEMVAQRLAWMDGSQWITDGATNQRLKAGEPIPEGWSPGRTWPNRWITDGTRNSRTTAEVPPEGWWFGRAGDFREKISLTKAQK